MKIVEVKEKTVFDCTTDEELGNHYRRDIYGNWSEEICEAIGHFENIQNKDTIDELEKSYQQFLVDDAKKYGNCWQCKNHVNQTVFESSGLYNDYVCHKGLSPVLKCCGFVWR